MKNQLTAKEIIKGNTFFSTGCTEPVAVAWACSNAYRAIGGELLEVEVSVDPNVYKNGLSVGIPHSGGKYGLEVAAALGAAGDPSQILRVLETISEQDKEKMFKLIQDHKVRILLNEDAHQLYIEAKITTDKGTAIALVENFHTNLTKLIVNGKELPIPCYDAMSDEENNMIMIGDQKVADLVALTDNIDDELADWIMEGIHANMEIACVGLEKNDFGLSVGHRLRDLVEKGLLGDDAANYASYMTAAAVDARMSGANISVMTNSGSGNQGLGTVVPVVSFAAFNKITDQKRIIKAVAIAHMISIYVKQHTGLLSCLCGCAHGATAGAASGILSLLGYNADAIERALRTITADLTGVICDGGKPGCALKLALSAGEAVRIAYLSAAGLEANSSDGIVGKTAEDSISNMGQLSRQCAKTADQTILHIMSQLSKN